MSLWQLRKEGSVDEQSGAFVHKVLDGGSHVCARIAAGVSLSHDMS